MVARCASLSISVVRSGLQRIIAQRMRNRAPGITKGQTVLILRFETFGHLISSRGLMVRASDFYSEDWGFKSLREFSSIFLGYFYSIETLLVVSK